MTRYFRREWDENPGGTRAAWGASVWYFETDDGGQVLRQVEAYSNGKVLRYGPEHDEDEDGFRTYTPLDLDEFGPFECDAATFAQTWGGPGE